MDAPAKARIDHLTASRRPREGFNPLEAPMRHTAFVSVFLLAVSAALVGMRSHVAVAGDDAEKPARDKEEWEKRVAGLLERLRAKDVVVRAAAARDAKDCEDPRVTAALAHALSDSDGEVRKTAARVLGTRTDDAEKKSAARALSNRLPRLDASPDLAVEQEIVVDALHDLAQPLALKVLVDGLDLDDADLRPTERRLRAIANLPTKDAVAALIGVLAREGRGGGAWRRAVRGALVYATGEKLGNDPDAWRAWWRKHEDTFDVAAAAARRAKERLEADEREERRRAREGKGSGMSEDPPKPGSQ
jgi:HEAT repeat protein